MKYLIILFFFVSLTTTAQQRITIRSKAAVDSIFKAGDTLKYRIAGTNKSVGTFAGSGGIGSLNGLTGATQTFVNETNIGISSTGTTHTLTWSGTLSDGRIASASNWNAKIGAGDTASMLSPYLRSNVAASTYQTILGFTPENVANKATDFSTVNNILYPSTQAIVNYVSAQNFVTRSELIDSLNNLAVIEGDKTLDSLMWQKNDSTVVIKSVRVTQGSSKISVVGSGTDSTRQWAVDVNEANLTLGNIGGNLNASQIAQGGATSGQVLKWNGSAWAAGTDNSSSVPNGGTTGQVLTKNSNTDGDADWQTPTGGGMADPGANGIVVRTALNTTTSRSITIKNGAGTINNANGVDGNPEIDIAFVSGASFKFEAEFLNTNAVQSQYIGSALASGTNSTAPAAGVITPNHPGVILIRSSTTANSGYVYITGTAARMEIGGGEVYNFNYRTPAAFTNTTWRAGYHTATNQTDATDGVYFELNGSGAIVGKTANNSTRTTSATVATLSANTWYHGRIVVNDAKTEAVFTIFDDAGISLGTQTITTNFPASGRLVGSGLVATNSGTTATDLIYIDYMNSFTTKKLQRGAY